MLLYRKFVCNLVMLILNGYHPLRYMDLIMVFLCLLNFFKQFIILVKMMHVYLDPQQSFFLLLGLVRLKILWKLAYNCILLCFQRDPSNSFFIVCYGKGNSISIVSRLCSLMTIHQHWNYSPNLELIMETCIEVYLLSNKLREFKSQKLCLNPNPLF